MAVLFWIAGFMFTVGFVREMEGEMEGEMSLKNQILLVFGCFGLWPLMLGVALAKMRRGAT